MKKNTGATVWASLWVLAVLLPSAAIAAPVGWTSADIGAVGVSGSALQNDGNNGAWTVQGSGSDIWGTDDSFQFLYQQTRMTSGTLTVRVDDLQNTSPFAKSGLMLRNSLDPNAATIILDMKPNGQLEFMFRRSAGSDMIWLTSPVTTPPVWLRIAWYNGGNQTYPSYSYDGINWQSVYCGGDGCSFNISSPVYAGVAVTSHDNGTLMTSHIEGLSLLAAPWTSADIGATGITGNAVVNDATGASYTIQGAGADIWGTADAFQFVYQGPGNGAIQLHVASEQATDPFAKVGVMIRSSLTANAAFVILDMKPSGELEFMQRATDGDYVNYLGGAAPGFTWIQLARQDSSITVSASTDGSTWKHVGTTSVTFGFTGALGIAVTSHDTSQLNTSTVDNVVVK